MSFLRKISPAEANHLAKDKLGSGQFVNQFFIEGEFDSSEQPFTKEVWQAAISKAAEFNPAICVRLKAWWGFRYWKKVDMVPEFIYFDGTWSGDNSKGFEKIAPFINPRKDNVASITIIDSLEQKASNKAIILFRIHHGVCDGAAMAHWIQEVFRALRNEQLIGSHSSLNELEIVKRENYPPPDTFRGLCLPVFPKSQQTDLTSCHWTKTHWQMSDQRIVAKIMIALRDIAYKEHGEGKTVFRLTSDLRHYLNENEKQIFQFSNLSGIMDIAVTSEDTVKSVQFRIIRALRNKRDLSVFPKRFFSLSNWLPGNLFNLNPKWAENMHKRGVCNITAMIGYANHIDLSAVSFNGFKATGAFAIPMNIEDKSLFLGVASNPGGIDVIALAPNALSNIENTHTLCETLYQDMLKLN